MRIVTWNVNSIRARIDLLIDVVGRLEPDVLLLQETRCADVEFPHLEFAARGYEVAHHGNHHRNGVAIASRVGLDGLQAGFRSPPVALGSGPDDGDFAEARLVSATCGGVRCHSVYVPNGREIDHPQYRFKLAWLDHLRSELADEVAAGTPTVIGGDFNIAPADIDIYDPVRWRGETHASPRERAALGALLGIGLHDVMRELDPSPGLYTWWNYRPGQFEQNRGLRIDLFLVSSDIANATRAVTVDRDGRRPGTRPSDHAPVSLDVGVK